MRDDQQPVARETVNRLKVDLLARIDRRMNRGRAARGSDAIEAVAPHGKIDRPVIQPEAGRDAPRCGNVADDEGRPALNGHDAQRGLGAVGDALSVWREEQARRDRWNRTEVRRPRGLQLVQVQAHVRQIGDPAAIARDGELAGRHSRRQLEATYRDGGGGCVRLEAPAQEAGGRGQGKGAAEQCGGAKGGARPDRRPMI